MEAGKLFFESLLGHNKQYKKGMALLSFCSRLAPFLDKMHWTINAQAEERVSLQHNSIDILIFV